MSVCTDACLRWGWHLLRESRGEGRRKPATPPMPRVEVDSPQLDHATVFWGRFFSRHHKTAEKASPQRPGILRASVISRLDPYNRLRGPVREKRPLALTRRGFFLSGLFRRGEATTPPRRITGGAAPSPPLALPLVFLLSLSSTSGLVGHLPHLSARLPGWDAKKPGVSAARRASSFCVEPKASKQPPPATEGAGREVRRFELAKK